MLRHDRLKYIHCAGDPEQLYDLEADPQELRDLAGDAAYAGELAAARAALDERYDLPALEASVVESQRRRRLVWPALASGAYTPWDFQPYLDASLLYVRGDAARNPRPGRSRPSGALPPA
jgi:choline-sulfatase